jgi:hypothetical protein
MHPMLSAGEHGLVDRPDTLMLIGEPSLPGNFIIVF